MTRGRRARRAGRARRSGRVVSHVFDWDTLPDQLPELHTKLVFVRDPVTVAG
jgi:hypothetical protein